jgi:hypothetical protein
LYRYDDRKRCTGYVGVRKEMTPIFCSRCGEFTIAYTTVNGTIYCRECFEELEFSHNLEYLKKQKGNKK